MVRVALSTVSAANEGQCDVTTEKIKRGEEKRSISGGDEEVRGGCGECGERGCDGL